MLHTFSIYTLLSNFIRNALQFVDLMKKLKRFKKHLKIQPQNVSIRAHDIRKKTKLNKHLSQTIRQQYVNDTELFTRPCFSTLLTGEFLSSKTRLSSHWFDAYAPRDMTSEHIRG